MCSSSQRTVSGTSMTSCSDVDSAYASMKGASPDRELGVITPLVESPIQENYPDHHHNNNNISDYDDNYGDDEDDDWSEGDEVFEDPDPSVMLPPTVSTYMHREKPVPRPPSQAVLQAELVDCLGHARNALDQTEQESDPARADAAVAVTASSGWHEIQGMHILDVLTLAIRAAKVYYTSHDRPDRLDAIKSERAVRTELLAVMDVLKRMATRRFAGGVRPDEIRDLRKWLDSLDAMLAQEAALAAAERQARAGWTWLESANANANIPSSSSSSSSSSCQRERAFLQSMLAAAIPEDRLESASVELPPWIPLDQLASPSDSVFLRHMQSGVRLVQLHNCAVRTSRRRFGAIAAFHADTQKPYRAAENLRYWHKAAELRWEVLLPPIDALAIARASSESVDPAVWQAFEKALLCWCRAVREEITAEVQSS